MIKEKIKAGDFFTLYYLDSNPICPNYYCWPIRSIARVVTVNTEEQYIGCNIICPSRNLYSEYNETFQALIKLGGWTWRYNLEFLFGGKVFQSRRSSSNEIFRYILEYSTFVQDLDPFD